MDTRNDSLRLGLLCLLASEPSDIHQHVMTLAHLAAQSSTVVELGTRTGVSTLALFLGGIGRAPTRGPDIGGGWNARSFALRTFDIADCWPDVDRNLHRLVSAYRETLGAHLYRYSGNGDDSWENEALGALRESFRRHVEVSQQDSVKAVASMLPGSVSMLFIDTTHTLEQTRAELEVWDERIAPLGMIVGHDSHHPDYGVREAVLAFAARNVERYYPPALHDWNNGLFILRRRS